MREPTCLARLGYLHTRGLGVVIDFRQAEEYYNSAISLGSTAAMVGLAEILLFGCGYRAVP